MDSVRLSSALHRIIFGSSDVQLPLVVRQIANVGRHHAPKNASSLRNLFRRRRAIRQDVQREPLYCTLRQHCARIFRCAHRY